MKRDLLTLCVAVSLFQTAVANNAGGRTDLLHQGYTVESRNQIENTFILVISSFQKRKTVLCSLRWT